MDERPDELRRQRELIAAHLRWLDEQIARSAGATPPAPTPSIPSVPAEALRPVATPAQSAAEAEALAGFAMPEIDPGSIRNEVKRGCLIYVIVVSLLLAASIAAAWWVVAQE